MSDREKTPYTVAASERPHLNRARIAEQIIGAVVVALIVSIGNHLFVVRDLQHELRQQRETIEYLKQEVREMRRDLYLPPHRRNSASITQMPQPQPEPSEQLPTITAIDKRRNPPWSCAT